MHQSGKHDRKLRALMGDLEDLHAQVKRKTDMVEALVLELMAQKEPGAVPVLAMTSTPAKAEEAVAGLYGDYQRRVDEAARVIQEMVINPLLDRSQGRLEVGMMTWNAETSPDVYAQLQEWLSIYVPGLGCTLGVLMKSYMAKEKV